MYRGIGNRVEVFSPILVEPSTPPPSHQKNISYCRLNYVTLFQPIQQQPFQQEGFFAGAQDRRTGRREMGKRGDGFKRDSNLYSIAAGAVMHQGVFL